ncbi:MAG: glycosyltransferase family 2 protein [Chloroflexi bacterium]|nr:glycosyltransferase family 2 protein [Chloroflexota bacterium]
MENAEPTAEEGPFLSIVIPAYNEERRILKTLERVLAFLKAQPYTWEVLVVDDGSTDSTAGQVEELARGEQGLRVLRLGHQGKGWAVKQGMLDARGRFRFFCDADLAMPIDQLPRFLERCTAGVPVVIGSREAPGARRFGEPLPRHWMGRIFNGLVRLLAVPGIMDTQCGFKCFSSESAEALFPAQRLKGFSFDVEVLFLARQLGLPVEEIPIDWYHNPNSKVIPWRDVWVMSRDLLRIRLLHRRGRYLGSLEGMTKVKKRQHKV